MLMFGRRAPLPLCWDSAWVKERRSPTQEAGGQT
jgi:hypothetical protein